MLQAIVCGILGVRTDCICARLTTIRSEQFVRSDDRPDEVAIRSTPANMIQDR